MLLEVCTRFPKRNSASDAGYRGNHHSRQQGAREGSRKVRGQVNWFRDGASHRAPASPGMVR